MRYKTTLFLHEIESEAEWPIYDKLDRDMQETWAVHGVYPTIAWTPDSKSIVFWADGKIQSIDVQTKKATQIPFHVKTQRTIGKAVRFSVEIAPDTFKTRMLRWATVSPNGKQVAFQVLGHIYIRDLPDGKERRLTQQNDHFEFYPAWSRDSRSIVYTTWNDEKLGTVRVAPAKGGQGKILTDKPGHYIEPAFSPDGQTVVYRKISNDRLRTPTWTADRGIYKVPIRTGKPELITKKGVRPLFGKDNDRLFLLDIGSDGSDERRALVSIDLDGSDRRTHLVSKNATEY
ncbi:MAG: TolB family protein, partial [Planctomycetota bacterium]